MATKKSQDEAAPARKRIARKDTGSEAPPKASQGRNAPRKKKAAAPRKGPDLRKPSRRGRRQDIPPPKDEVERSERYVNARAAGAANPVVVTAQKRASLLKQLIEPKTEAMVNVLEEIAMNKCTQADGKTPVEVHPSIRMEAADRLLNRAYGKPKEHVVVEDEGGPTSADDEVLGLLNNILKSVGAPTIDGPATPAAGPTESEPASE